MPTERKRLANELAAIRGTSSTATPTLPQSGVVPYADLAGMLNQFMVGQSALAYQNNLPGYGTNLAQQSTNTGSMLRGEVPLDVRNQIQQAGAERGIATGAPGSSNANASWLKALGLTSLGLQQQGGQNFSQQIADTPFPEIWNPASLFQPQVLAGQEAGYAREGIEAGRAASTPPQQQYASYNPAAPWTNYNTWR